jgi:hypothetical protein
VCLTADLAYGNVLLGKKEKIMRSSYGETSGFTAVGAEELLLVNGGKGGSSGGGGGGGSSKSSTPSSTPKSSTPKDSNSGNTIYGNTSYMNPASQFYAQTVTNEYVKATTALAEAGKKVGNGIVAVTIALFSPPLASAIYTFLNPGSASHNTAH